MRGSKLLFKNIKSKGIHKRQDLDLNDMTEELGSSNPNDDTAIYCWKSRPCSLNGRDDILARPCQSWVKEEDEKSFPPSVLHCTVTQRDAFGLAWSCVSEEACVSLHTLLVGAKQNPHCCIHTHSVDLTLLELISVQFRFAYTVWTLQHVNSTLWGFIQHWGFCSVAVTWYGSREIWLVCGKWLNCQDYIYIARLFTQFSLSVCLNGLL